METFSQRLCASGLHQFEDYDNEIYPGPRCAKCGKWALKKEPFKIFNGVEIVLFLVVGMLVTLLIVNAGTTLYFLF